jgi:serine/threonine protein phosphatase PrpC
MNDRFADLNDTGEDPQVERPGPLTSGLTYEEFLPLSSAVAVELAARSHPGGRPVNEDHYLVLRMGRHQETIATSLPDGDVPARFDEAGYGMVVADGMGAAGVGETASRLAISTLAHLVLHFGRWNLRIDPRTAQEVLERAERFYHRIDEKVTEVSLRNPALAGMGATLTAAYSAGDALFVAHVGHSRAYLLRNGILTQLTRDQTFGQRVIDTGRPAPIELAAHDLRHILTDAIGGHAGCTKIQIGQFRLQHDDCVLLCTNGLTDVVDDQSGAAILRQSRKLDERCQALVDLALARGAADNVTATLAEYSVPGGTVRSRSAV